MRKDLAIVLTARTGSTRLPDKTMATVGNKPLIEWVIKRLQTIGHVALATTQEKGDDVLASYVQAMNVPVYRGSTDDVITRMDNALKKYFSDARYVMRGLGDCPFMAWELVARACTVLDRSESADTFAWMLPPYVWPVYGAREFPFTRNAWRRIVTESTEREHVDNYYMTNRDQFDIVWHERPNNGYFRNYRLEVDWPEDLELVREIAKAGLMRSPLLDVIKFLDRHHDIASINRERVERTGPSCYDYPTQRAWAKAIENKPIVDWENVTWNPQRGGIPQFCDSGRCMIGYAVGGRLFMKDGIVIEGRARIPCECKMGRVWH